MPAANTDQNNKSTGNVLVVDSGVGGLSVLLTIANKTPALGLHYVSDNAAFPYGDKSESFLIRRVSDVVHHALNAHEADIIVIACNTASTVVLPTLREQLSIPVVGVVPAIKTASQISQSRVFGLLATPGTVNRGYTKQLIDKHAADCSVISVGSSHLVKTVENYVYNGELAVDELATTLDQFDNNPRSEKIDTLVLGCTHFPLIANQIQALRANWILVDSGEAIARRVCDVLDITGSQQQKITSTHATRHIHFTDLSSKTQMLDTFLDEQGFDSPQELKIIAK